MRELPRYGTESHDDQAVVPNVPGLAKAEAREPGTWEACRAVAEGLDVDALELACSVSIESGWVPTSHNKAGAGGLIGFLPSTLRGLGWTGTPEEFRRQGCREQLAWVKRYFERCPRPPVVPGDVYLSIFWPAATGDPDATVIASQAKNPKVWLANPGLRGDDGTITAGSVRAVVLRVMARSRGEVPVPRRKGPTGPGTERVLRPVLVMLAFAGLLWYLSKSR